MEIQKNLVEREEIALVANELATNLLKHAGEGDIHLSSIESSGRVGIQIVSEDNGPGILDIEGALADGYSTAGSLGAGLGAVNRLMDGLEFSPGPHAGLRVVCQRWIRPSATDSFPRLLEFGAAASANPWRWRKGARRSCETEELKASNSLLAAWSRALVEDYRAVLGEQGKEYLTHITDAVAQMSALIDALLGFARTAQLPLHYADVDFNDLVQKIISEIQLEQAGRRIEWIVPPLPTVQADPTLLRQVWVNLIENAIKYTRKKESVRIEIGCKDQSPHEFVFFVKDNGAGFEMSHAEQLFGLFHRLHRADEFEGVGLGLANVRRIIDRHSGRTWAEGEAGKGATFYFSLPISGQ